MEGVIMPKNAAKLIAETSKDVTINVDGVKELAQVLPLSLIDSTLRCFVSHNSQYSRHNVHVHYRYLDLLIQCTQCSSS
jgi:predicted ATP-dependent protease